MIMMWKKEVTVLRVLSSAFTIEIQIEDLEGKGKWWLIGVYVDCEPRLRKEQSKVLNKMMQL